MMRVPAAHAGVVFVVNQERDSKQGNLLKGIDNWSGTARSAALGPKQSLWQKMTLFVILLQFRTIFFPYKLYFIEKRTYLNKLKFPIF